MSKKNGLKKIQAEEVEVVSEVKTPVRHTLAVDWDKVTSLDHIKTLLKGMNIQVFYYGDTMPDNVKEMNDTGILKAIES